MKSAVFPSLRDIAPIAITSSGDALHGCGSAIKPTIAQE
jgi:hypothetical protein